jgi:hypothetical protein
MGFFLIAVAWVIFNVLWTMSTVAACILARMPIKRLGIFYGPVVFSRQFDDVLLNIGCIPVGSYVKVDDQIFKRASREKKAFCLLFGAIWIWLFAVALLSFDGALAETERCRAELLHAAFSPLGLGKRWFANAATRPAQEIFGWTAVQCAVSCCIPVPPAGAGSALFWLLSDNERSHAQLAVFGTIFIVILYACLSIGYVAAAGEALLEFIQLTSD